ncbi:hypothetical protein DFQ30_005890 [Apophysomyces sp. BC1015]|nr:hypothetical protein DFQ30_005890 [Apophysomyces sp. BC1015]
MSPRLLLFPVSLRRTLCLRSQQKLALRSKIHSSSLNRQAETPTKKTSIRSVNLQAPAPASTEVDLFNSIASHQPRSNVVESEKYDKIARSLRLSFTVPQLRSFLKKCDAKQHGIKEELIKRIMTECWELKTREQLSFELKQKKLNAVSYQAEASREELFFVIGDNGATLRAIENQNEVNITINVANYRYTVHGTSEAVERAKLAIKNHLRLFHRQLDLPAFKELQYHGSIEREIKRVLVDISKASGVFIALENGKIYQLDFTDKQPLAASDYIAVANIDSQPTKHLQQNPYVLLPLQDEQAMPLFGRRVGWSRVSRTKSRTEDEDDVLKDKDEEDVENTQARFQLLEPRSTSDTEDSKIVDYADLKDMLTKSLNITDNKDKISLEATFGHLLLRNVVADADVSLLQPSMRTSFDASRLSDLLASHPNGRRLFFGSSPPHHINTALAPISLYAGFHRRLVKVEYVSLPLTAQVGSVPCETTTDDLQRLELQFSAEENGSLQLQQVTGEHARSAVDLINVGGNIDVRLLARRYSQFSRVKMPSWIQSLVDDCHLTGYSDLSCPNFWNQDSDLMLTDISFRNETRYLLESNLVTITHIEGQDGRTRRSELTVTPVVSEIETYSPVPNGLDRWDSFTKAVNQLAKRWSYSA